VTVAGGRLAISGGRRASACVLHTNLRTCASELQSGSRRSRPRPGSSASPGSVVRSPVHTATSTADLPVEVPVDAGATMPGRAPRSTKSPPAGTRAPRRPLLREDALAGRFGDRASAESGAEAGSHGRWSSRPPFRDAALSRAVRRSASNQPRRSLSSPSPFRPLRVLGRLRDPPPSPKPASRSSSRAQSGSSKRGPPGPRFRAAATAAARRQVVPQPL